MQLTRFYDVMAVSGGVSWGWLIYQAVQRARGTWRRLAWALTGWKRTPRHGGARSHAWVSRERVL